jgi:hypothetical protein
MKKPVHYFTPQVVEEDFMIAAVAEKLGGIEEERVKAIRLATMRAATQAPFDQKTVERTLHLMKDAGDELKGLTE